MLLDDVGDVVDFYIALECSLGIDDNNGTARAQTETSRLHYLNGVLKIVVAKLLLEFLSDFTAIIGSTSRSAAYQYVTFIHNLSPFF